MSLATTVLDEYRLTVDKSNLDAHENRMANYGAYETFFRDRENLIPGYQEFLDERKGADRTMSIVVQQVYNPSTAATRTCTASTAEETSAYVTPSWTTIETAFSMVPAQNQNNYITYQQQFNAQMKGVERVFLEAVDTAAVAHLEANRTTTNLADDKPFNFTANSMVIPVAAHDTVFNEMDQVFMQNDYPAGMPKNVVGSPYLSSVVNYYKNQGASNSANTVFQYAGFEFGYTNNISVTATSDVAIMYVMPVGTLAYLSWIDPDCRMGNSIGEEKMWFTQMLPLLGHEVGVYYQAACADKSSRYTSLTRTKAESFEFSFDYSLISSYISTGATPIFKANLQSV